MTNFPNFPAHRYQLHFIDKHYDHSRGMSASFAQWRADSHCKDPHGYALAFTLTFGAYTLDTNNWVQDFGGLDPVWEWMKKTFDHCLLISADDPRIEWYKDGSRQGFLGKIIVCEKGVGCEMFANMIYDKIEEIMPELTTNENEKLVGLKDRVLWLHRVRVAEHPGNAAYIERYPHYVLEERFGRWLNAQQTEQKIGTA